PDVISQGGIGCPDHPATGLGDPEPLAVVADAEVAEPDDPCGRKGGVRRTAHSSIEIALRLLDALAGGLGVLFSGAPVRDLGGGHGRDARAPMSVSRCMTNSSVTSIRSASVCSRRGCQ